MFSRAEGLEGEGREIGELIGRLEQLQGQDGEAPREEARRIVGRLYNMNLRWNNPKLAAFLRQQGRELFSQ